MAGEISFYQQDCDFNLSDQEDVIFWIHLVTNRYKKKVKQFSYIFCSDDYLLEKNRELLDHDYYTDIITVPYDEGSDLIADFFISIDRVRENSIQFEMSFIDELHRVMIHGVLHLVGFKDDSDELKERMRKEEDLVLSLRMF